MTKEQFLSVIELCGATEEKGRGHSGAPRWKRLPEGRTLTVSIAFNGVGLTVGRVTELRMVDLSDGVTQLHVKTARDELHVVALADAFACSIDESGPRGRKAGFL